MISILDQKLLVLRPPLHFQIDFLHLILKTEAAYMIDYQSAKRPWIKISSIVIYCIVIIIYYFIIYFIIFIIKIDWYYLKFLSN